MLYLVNTFTDTQISRTCHDFTDEIQGLSRTCVNPNRCNNVAQALQQSLNHVRVQLIYSSDAVRHTKHLRRKDI